MLFLSETLLAITKEHQTITTHNTNRHCRVRLYACVGQPLSKQLCVVLPCSQDNNISMARFAF